MTDSSLVLVANAGDNSISVFRLVGDALERLAVTADLPGTGTFAVDEARDLVYAGVKGDPAAIVTLALDRETGTLTPRSRFALPGGSVSYIALTRDGSALLAASYGGDYGVVAPIVDGVVGEPTGRVEFSKLHSVLPSADGRFVYFVSLGDDLVAAYALADDLTLSPVGTAAAPAGSGPRHLVLTAAQDAVYVMTEYSGEVLHYARDRDTGTLELRSQAPAVDPAAGLVRGEIGADPVAHHAVWGADIHLGADERHLWTSERSTSSLGAVPVAQDGTVRPVENFIPTEPQPRGFAVSRAGDRLVAAGERSVTVSLYAVDGVKLTLLQQIETGAGANWVRFL
ncbi:beta-propeller fold lactonase family protein [Microbacterium sp. NM3R9]|uniref:lactonase family protein n=1 Tax=Microbacterium thalli TaxID=3027921 RepID=UPI002366BC2E|nr:beta-propeller fold lactonase family protein [Microbacterium thalli]MDN8549485.1 beta-propeller fold lactonase family protein [Microbacterium thalli]